MNAHKTDETSKVDPIQVILVSLSIILTILGQILLYTTPIDNAVVVPGVIWWSVSGIGLFIFSLFFRPRQFLVNASQKLSQNTVQGWVIFSLILSILAGLSSYLFEKYVLTNFIPVLSLWFLAIFCYVMAFFPANFLWKNCIDWIQKYRLELFWLGLVGVMGIGLRFYKLGELPRTINGDEARIGLFAQGSIEGTLSNPFALW